MKESSNNMENLNSNNIILLLKDENRTIFEQNSNTAVPIASLTKIMTTILTLENQSPTSVVKITTPMVSGLTDFAVAGLQAGQELTVEELLYLTMLPSAGDAAQALAISTSGSIANFAKLMNEKAKSLGMNATHFSNPVGQDENNYSTAQDLAILLQYALKNPDFVKIFNTFEYNSKTLGKTIYKTVDTNNVFTGAKTGFTYDAGRCLASTATLNNINYLLITLGADWTTKNHVQDSLKIYDYFSKNYGYKTIKSTGDELLSLEVHDSNTKTFPFYAEQNIEAYFKNDYDLNNLIYSYEGNEIINNKTETGEFLGTYRIFDESELLYEQPLYYNGNIEFYPYWLWNTIVATVFCGLVLWVIISWRKRRCKSRRCRR